MKTMLERGAGILMPIFSLPSPYGIGTMGKDAYDFVDKLKKARQMYWQVLPIGPTSYGDSPYQGFSAFAGNPYFIDLDTLKDEGLITQDEINECYWYENEDEVKYDAIYWYRFPLLRKAFERSKHYESAEYKKFLEDSEYWLQDYCLYMAIKKASQDKCWTDWEDGLKFKKPDAIKAFEKEHETDLNYWKFIQFKFFEQWSKLKKYANDNDIEIIGDIPIYVAFDSADVWSNPLQFQIDEVNLLPKAVAGVPPDAFTADGQLWGNPLYDWKKMEKDNFTWWRKRMEANASLFDVIRIDHFIGIVQYFSVPYGDTTARNGHYEKGPGKKLTDVIKEVCGDKTKIIAEDLGVFSQDVKDLLDETGFPGMKIIEFAFSGDRFNEHLPHMYTPNMVVYGGTHDNETLVGYFKPEARQWWELQYIVDYLGCAHKEEVVDRVFKAAYRSVASVAIFQMQDVLLLDNWARMNAPGSFGTNWKWRMTKWQFNDDRIGYLAWLVDNFGRFRKPKTSDNK